MRPLSPRFLWSVVAILGACAAVQTVAQDRRANGLPAIPPLPAPDGGVRPMLTGPQTPTPQPVPVPVQPRIYTPTPRHTPAPTQTAPAPAPTSVPEGRYSPDAQPAHEPQPYGQPTPYSAAPSYPAPRRHSANYQYDQGVDPGLYYNDAAPYGGRYPQPVGSPYYYSPEWSYSGGNAYDVHFGPGFYRSGEYGHLRFPYYSYRRPWYNPGPAVYVRDTNLHW